jgi:formylglycine-generating enzyme required for sulfatase activity
MKTTNPLAILLATLVLNSSAQAVTIEMVTVGNPGNAPAGTIGGVGYLYQIGKYEVTAGQYTEFLNAVAHADPNGLYDTEMASSTNIQRNGTSPNFSYGVASDWANRPANLVSFWDVARFSNWLHNGQPTGAQGPGTTEDGAYQNVGDQTLFGRSAGARFFIPTEDEWYKAAYHDKIAGLAASYFNYPTGTNSASGRDVAETTNAGNNANYFSADYLIGSPYYRTLVGEFELSDSPYGTFDQGGNVWEWTEAAESSFGGVRILRGSSYTDGLSKMRRSERQPETPTVESPNWGFRVASIFEPDDIGDYNRDSIVDAADYVVWRKTGGMQAGYDTWRAHFGETFGSGAGASGAVPEPTSQMMLILGMLAIFFRRRAVVS